ncbi:hypothetical protein Tco_0101724 [Tanacetum coccineum]
MELHHLKEKKRYFSKPIELFARSFASDITIATMTPPIEMSNKPADSYHHSHAPLNERILSSLKRRSAASHPWHDRSTNNIQIRVIYTQVEEGDTKLIYAAASEVVSLL